MVGRSLQSGRWARTRIAILSQPKVGSKMIIGFMAGAILYGAVTLLFLILSTSDLLDDFQDTHIRLTKVFFVSVFWPLSVLVMTVRVLSSRLAAVSQMFPNRRNINASRPLRHPISSA